VEVIATLYPGVKETPGAVFRFGDPGGPLAVPGTYGVRLTAGGETQTQTFEIVKDPRIQTTRAEFEEQFRLAVHTRDKAREVFAAVAEIRDVRSQLSKAGINSADRRLLSRSPKLEML
jgi:hypothetical protein